MADAGADKPKGEGTYHSDIGNEALPRTGWLADIHDEGEMFRLKELYDLGDATVIGKGGNGSVSVIKKRSNGESYALKTVVNKHLQDPQMRRELMKEIEMQSAMDHPNIVKVYEAFEDPKHCKMYIVMELCTGGDLCSRLRNPENRHGMGERGAATLMEEMLSAVHYCHSRGIVHRDIKLDNFMYEDPGPESALKLIDFGFACEVTPGHERMWDKLGTPSYMAPELWGAKDREGHLQHSYNSAVDMWALGVTIYFLIAGKRPWFHEDMAERARMICEDPVSFNGREWKNISAEGMDFIEKLLQKKPKERMSASDALEHPWIKDKSKLHMVSSAEDLAAHDEVVRSLQNFAASGEMQKVALEVLAFSTPPSKMKELRDIFIHMDKDDSGTISRDEFKEGMSKHPEIPIEQVDLLFNAMDQTHTGEIDYSEFLAAAISSQQTMDVPCVATVFGLLDKDGDGFISAADLIDALGVDGESSFERHEIEALLQQGAGVRDAASQEEAAGQRRHHQHHKQEEDKKAGGAGEIMLSINDFKYMMLQREARRSADHLEVPKSDKPHHDHHKHARLDQFVDHITGHFHKHAKAKHEEHAKGHARKSAAKPVHF